MSRNCVNLTLIRVFWKKNPKVGNSWERHLWKKNPKKIWKTGFGKTWERHLWKKNPDYYHDDLPIKIENLTFWEIPRASFLEKNPINIFGWKCGKLFLKLKRYMSHNDLWINWLLVGISNGVAIPAKSSVTNKRAQFVVLESKKTLDFFSRNDALGISQKSKKIKTILNYCKLCILDLFSINDALGYSQSSTIRGWIFFP